MNDKVTADSGEQKEAFVKKDDKVSVDKQAVGLKKRAKYYYGYKKHYVTDEEGLGVVSTKASVNEVSNLQEVLQAADLPEGIALKADKGYESEKNASLLKRKKRKNHILRKAKRGKPLTDFEKRFNKRVGETRVKIERTYGSIKRWFSGGVARYRGIAKMHTQNLMEAIGYNLYRSPGLLASNR